MSLPPTASSRNDLPKIYPIYQVLNDSMLHHPILKRIEIRFTLFDSIFLDYPNEIKGLIFPDVPSFGC